VEEVREKILNFKFEILNLRPQAVDVPGKTAKETMNEILNFKFQISNLKSTH